MKNPIPLGLWALIFAKMSACRSQVPFLHYFLSHKIALLATVSRQSQGTGNLSHEMTATRKRMRHDRRGNTSDNDTDETDNVPNRIPNDNHDSNNIEPGQDDIDESMEIVFEENKDDENEDEPPTPNALKKLSWEWHKDNKERMRTRLQTKQRERTIHDDIMGPDIAMTMNAINT